MRKRLKPINDKLKPPSVLKANPLKPNDKLRKVTRRRKVSWLGNLKPKPKE